jgi:hypothetical protein
VAYGAHLIPKQYVSRIVAVTMFGSPPCSIIKGKVPELADRCRSFCNSGDTVRATLYTQRASLTDSRSVMVLEAQQSIALEPVQRLAVESLESPRSLAS